MMRVGFDAVAHVDLLAQAVEDGRQRFVDRIQADEPGQPGMDIDVLLGVAREREQQLFYRDFVDDHAVSRRLDGRFGRRHEIARARRRRYVRQ